jgi:hypothetical protein
MENSCKRWKIFGWDSNGTPLPPRYVYDDDAYSALRQAKERYRPDYTAAQADPISPIIPLDRNNLDGYWGYHAVHCDWPAGLSYEGKLALQCYDKDIFLFKYEGKYVLTKRELTEYNDGKISGRPIAVFKHLNELDGILTQLYEDTAGSRWPA